MILAVWEYWVTVGLFIYCLVGFFFSFFQLGRVAEIGEITETHDYKFYILGIILYGIFMYILWRVITL